MCGCDAQYAGLISIASTMHDVGKICIPTCILKKRGALDREERQIVQRHAEYGAQLLSGIALPVLEVAAQIAHCHHEHFDGTGYPRGLKGDQIPLSGRIVAVIDVFDALVMDRAYRRAMPVDHALQLIRAGRARQFDPDVVDAFLSIADEILMLCERMNEDKSLAEWQWPGCETQAQPFAFYDRSLRSLPYANTTSSSWTDAVLPTRPRHAN
jgi:putative two-component system response regulator